MAVSERGGEEWRGKIGRTVPIWFAYRKGQFYIISRERYAWARCVHRDPRVCFCATSRVGSGVCWSKAIPPRLTRPSTLRRVVARYQPSPSMHITS
jgi:hypothetical protein